MLLSSTTGKQTKQWPRSRCGDTDGTECVDYEDIDPALLHMEYEYRNTNLIRFTNGTAAQRWRAPRLDRDSLLGAEVVASIGCRAGRLFLFPLNIFYSRHGHCQPGTAGKGQPAFRACLGQPCNLWPLLCCSVRLCAPLPFCSHRTALPSAGPFLDRSSTSSYPIVRTDARSVAHCHRGATLTACHPRKTPSTTLSVASRSDDVLSAEILFVGILQLHLDPSTHIRLKYRDRGMAQADSASSPKEILSSDFPPVFCRPVPQQ